MDKDEPKNIWGASQQVAVARGVSLAKVGPASLERGGEEREIDRNRQTWTDKDRGREREATALVVFQFRGSQVQQLQTCCVS